MSRTTDLEKTPWLPPRWFIHFAWIAHRTIYRATGGRRGLNVPAGSRFGTMRLRTVGRRSGKERAAILGYFEDGRNLVTLAMNGWGAAEPAWWLNLQANPDAEIDVKGAGSRPVRARAAIGEERTRLWARFDEFPGWGRNDVSAYSKKRPGETAVVVLEPR